MKNSPEYGAGLAPSRIFWDTRHTAGLAGPLFLNPKREPFMDENIERKDKENISAETSAAEATEAKAPDDGAAAPESSDKNDAELAAAAQDEQPASEEDAAESAPGAAAENDEKDDEDTDRKADEKPAEDDAPITLETPVPDAEEAQDSISMPAAAVPAPPASGPAAKLFEALSYAGLPVLLILAAAMTFLEVWQVRDLWFSDEVRLADAFMNLKGGDWLMLTMNGLPYPDKPPLYFWFMDALTRIPGVGAPMVLFLAVAVSHLLFIGSVWLLARGTGHDRREAFAAGLVALGCVYISGAACYPRMDLFFAAFVTLGMTCLYRGWIKSFAPFWLAAGFVLMGAATLIKSPLGIAFAVVTSVLFLFWRGTPGRLNGRDGLPGFVLMLLILMAWAGALYLGGHQDYLRNMVSTQLAGRVLEGGNHAQPWWYYLAALPVVWLPWILVVLFVNWFAALRGIPSAWRTRKENGGSSWLWIWLVTGVAMLSAVQAKMVVYALPLLAPLAVLTGRSVMRLTPGRSRFFFSLVSVVLALAGLALVVIEVFPVVRPYIGSYLPAVPAVADPWLNALHGTMYMGGVLILLSVVLLFFTRLALPGGALLVTAIGMIVMLQPYQAFVAPSMDKLLSPRVQAEAMASKVKEGYAPAAFNVYPGAYAWHLNLLLPQQGRRLAVPDLAASADRDAWLKAHPRTVMAMPAADWEAWTDKPAGAEVLVTSWMVHKPYVVVAVNGAAPSAAEAPVSVEDAAAAAAESPAAAEEAPVQDRTPAAVEPAPEKTESPAAPDAEQPAKQPAPLPEQNAQAPAGA